MEEQQPYRRDGAVGGESRELAGVVVGESGACNLACLRLPGTAASVRISGQTRVASTFDAKRSVGRSAHRGSGRHPTPSTAGSVGELHVNSVNKHIAEIYSFHRPIDCEAGSSQWWRRLPLPSTLPATDKLYIETKLAWIHG